jgi:DNA-binding transcriptional ArsR family regulator
MRKVQLKTDAVFSALADSTRREILERLARRPLTVQEIADDLPISRPAVSRHIRVLKDAGLLSAPTESRKDAYHLAPEGLAVVDLWLARYRMFWNKRLIELSKRFDQKK